MDLEVAKECTVLSYQGKITFPEVVMMLLNAGYDAYYADLVSSTNTFYTQNTAHTINPPDHPSYPLAETFNAPKVVSAIREIQAQKIGYPQFLKEIQAAGVFAYMIFLKGKKAIYFGKNGDQHIEEFKK